MIDITKSRKHSGSDRITKYFHMDIISGTTIICVIMSWMTTIFSCSCFGLQLRVTNGQRGNRLQISVLCGYVCVRKKSKEWRSDRWRDEERKGKNGKDNGWGALRPLSFGCRSWWALLMATEGIRSHPCRCARHGEQGWGWCGTDDVAACRGWLISRVPCHDGQHVRGVVRRRAPRRRACQ